MEEVKDDELGMMILLHSQSFRARQSFCISTKASFHSSDNSSGSFSEVSNLAHASADRVTDLQFKCVIL